MEETLGLSAATAAAEHKRSERRRPPAPKAAPWLVIRHRKGMKDQAFYNLCEPQNKTCRKCIPEMSQTTFWQKPSHQGWMVTLCHGHKVDCSSKHFSNWKFGNCFLWNPVTLETIQLPSLVDYVTKYWIRDCVLSSPPKTTTNPEGDSMVIFLIQLGHDQFLLYCRPGDDDEHWRTKTVDGRIRERGLRDTIMSLVCFKGKLYAICLNERHLEIEIQQLGPGNEILSFTSFKVDDSDTIRPSVGDYCVSSTHYGGFCHELVKVNTIFNPRCYDKIVTSVQILRLNFSLMAWENMKSLGDHVLFFGQNTSAYCSATDLGLPRGCLYFTNFKDQSLYKFEVEDNAITPILPCLNLPTPWYLPEWMMIPTNVRVADGRRRMEDILGKDKEEEDNFVEVEEYKTSTIICDKKENQGKIHNGGDLEEARTWDTLNGDIVELIATNYLHPVDCLHYRAVCKTNRSTIPAKYRISSSTGFIERRYLSPWLVFSKDNDTIYNFVDPMHNNEKYLMNISELLVGATIRFSKGGWLLMSKGIQTLFFHNPFTRVTIQLPDLPVPYCFTGVSFSSLPTSLDCVVFGIAHLPDNELSIYVIARGNDSWRSHIFDISDLEKYRPCVNSPVFFDGVFYCLDYNGSLGVLNTEDGLIWEVLEHPTKLFNAGYPSFLVECDKKLLLVDLGHLGKSLGIFRLDFSKMIWVKVESLGNHMLFISNTSCLSAIAPDSSMENKIYFPRLHGEEILFYSLDTGGYHTLGSRHSIDGFYDTTERLNCAWIEPNWSGISEKQLDWHLAVRK